MYRSSVYTLRTVLAQNTHYIKWGFSFVPLMHPYSTLIFLPSGSMLLKSFLVCSSFIPKELCTGKVYSLETHTEISGFPCPTNWITVVMWNGQGTFVAGSSMPMVMIIKSGTPVSKALRFWPHFVLYSGLYSYSPSHFHFSHLLPLPCFLFGILSWLSLSASFISLVFAWAN